MALSTAARYIPAQASVVGWDRVTQGDAMAARSNAAATGIPKNKPLIWAW
jgi:hypothetical protein